MGVTYSTNYTNALSQVIFALRNRYKTKCSALKNIPDFLNLMFKVKFWPRFIKSEMIREV